MENQPIKPAPLVSVIVPCYNHAHFLPDSIESLLNQTYPAVEIVVVDDGSSDNTREVVSRYQGVRYVHKENGGLSAARNTGIEHSTGELLVFLDADDWLFPDALEINACYLLQEKEAAFVTGAFDRVYEDDNIVEEIKREVSSNHYLHLLQGNYIGVPAAAMYRRWVFNDLLYDTTPPNSCADYDLYLRIARRFPVLHHTQKIAAYRIHAASMSSNVPAMLDTVLKVLNSQKAELRSSEEHKAFENGQNVWKDYYCKEIYQKLRARRISASNSTLLTLLKYRPKFFLKYFLAPQYQYLKSVLKKATG